MIQHRRRKRVVIAEANVMGEEILIAAAPRSIVEGRIGRKAIVVARIVGEICVALCGEILVDTNGGCGIQNGKAKGETEILRKVIALRRRIKPDKVLADL